VLFHLDSVVFQLLVRLFILVLLRLTEVIISAERHVMIPWLYLLIISACLPIIVEIKPFTFSSLSPVFGDLMFAFDPA
jgi:hypothetical protein